MNDIINTRAKMLLALLYAGDNETLRNEIEGITRLEKLIFLLQKETGLTIENLGKEGDFNFIPFKMGPWSNEVYDEIDFLESMGLVEKRSTKINEPANLAHDEMLFGEAILDKYQKSYPNLDKDIELYRLTEKGKQKALQLWSSLNDIEKGKLINLKRKYNKMNLKQLLRYVYTKYPDYTSKSEIKESVFS